MATAQEQAVRKYLTALKDPRRLRDDKRITGLQDQIKSTDDPVKRVKLHAELRRAQEVDPDSFKAGFIAHAKKWADKQGVTAQDFKALDVPAGVLREAGFTVGGGGPRRRAKAAPRRGRVRAGDVEKALPRGKFTIPELVDKTGASPATVRKVVKDLHGAGKLEELGPDGSHKGRGRAPVAYKQK